LLLLLWEEPKNVKFLRVVILLVYVRSAENQQTYLSRRRAIGFLFFDWLT